MPLSPSSAHVGAIAILHCRLASTDILLAVEYTRFCRTSCQGYLYEKAVVAKALDNLKDLELVVCGREALATAASGGVGLNAGGVGRRAGVGASATLMTAALPAQLRNFQPIACFVTSPLITACLDAYPGCPMELSQWAHSRTL